MTLTLTRIDRRRRWNMHSRYKEWQDANKPVTLWRGSSKPWVRQSNSWAAWPIISSLAGEENRMAWDLPPPGTWMSLVPGRPTRPSLLLPQSLWAPEPLSTCGATEATGGGGGVTCLFWECWAALGAWAPWADLYPPFTPVIRSTTSADKAIKNSMLCPAALSHQNSYFGSERGRLSYPNYLPGGGKVGHVTSLELCCCLTNFL